MLHLKTAGMPQWNNSAVVRCPYECTIHLRVASAGQQGGGEGAYGQWWTCGQCMTDVQGINLFNEVGTSVP
jgi:hypothetical protein